MIHKIDIYTDGSSRGNPGQAGWAGIVFDYARNSVVELGGREDVATNNRMELMAVYKALVYIEECHLLDLPITLYIDSAYVQKGVTIWMYAWEKNDWRTKDGNPVLNLDIWKELVFLVFRLKRKADITFQKIEGHAGHFGNECADRVATSFADKKPTPLYKGTLAEYERLYKSVIVPVKSFTRVIPKSTKSTGRAYSYVSLVAGVVYVDKDWPSCEARVKGKRGVKYKKVFSKIEEHALVDEYKKS
jgi:ribonuclease HI